MPKKRITASAKKTTRKKPPVLKKRIPRKKSEKIEEKLAHNLVELQKIYTNQAEKFDNLSKQISDLLILFESAAKSLGANTGMREEHKDKEFLEKVDKLLDQNKTIARGLTLVEERVRERVHGYHPPSHNSPEEHSFEGEKFKPPIGGKPLPKF
jgi:hypothetical protein